MGLLFLTRSPPDSDPPPTTVGLFYLPPKFLPLDGLPVPSSHMSKKEPLTFSFLLSSISLLSHVCSHLLTIPSQSVDGGVTEEESVHLLRTKILPQIFQISPVCSRPT